MNISITDEHKIIIKENAFSVVLDECNIHYIEELSDKAYYREDIEIYFKNNCDIYSDDVIDNEDIIKNILNAYFEYRREHDGENNMSWRECLEKAVEDFEFELEIYRNNYWSTRRKYCEKQLSRFLFSSKYSNKYDRERLRGNEDLFGRIHKDYYYYLKNSQKETDDSFECLKEILKKYENELKKYLYNKK